MVKFETIVYDGSSSSGEGNDRKIDRQAGFCGCLHSYIDVEEDS